MIEDFEIKKMAEYVVNVFDAIKKPKMQHQICDWFFDEGRYVFEKIKLNKKLYKKDDEGNVKIDDVDEFLRDISSQLKKKYVSQSIKESSIEQTLNYIKRAIGLEDKEIKILGVFVRYAFNRRFEDFYDHVRRFLDKDNVFAGKEISQQEYVRFKNHLKELGLHDVGFRGEDISDFTKKIFEKDYKNYDDFIQKIIGKNEKTSLGWKDFSFLENREYVADIMKAAIQNHEKGVNILFYGVPGTGKTEFAKVIAKKIKTKCFSIGEDDTKISCEEFESSKNYRFSKFNFMQKMLEHEPNTFLIMDEAEDIFYQGSLKKIQVNRMLENNQLPVIWITNRTMGADGAFLRRFSMAIPFKELADDVKVKIWSKTFSKNGIQIEDEKVKSLVHEYQMPVSFVASAARNAKITEKGIDIIEASLKSMQTLCFGEKNVEAEYNGVIDFDPKLLNTDTDLSKLSDQLLKKGKLNFSLCLYGVSGTGKSAYGVWLAKKLGLKTIKIRCSDIMDKFVGESEQNIKDAFAKAKKEKAVLIFDEADSFLQDRTMAHNSWEVTGVNEMLTQMENHPYPFICTTNLLNKLDKASLRRFTFKVKYDYMTAEQSSMAFQEFFKIPNVKLTDMEKLTPADFANAWKKADFMDITDKEELIKLIKEEQDVREPVKYKLGF